MLCICESVSKVPSVVDNNSFNRLTILFCVYYLDYVLVVSLLVL